MFDIGPSELLLCAVVALVVIGPKDLPRVMRVVGQWVARARRMAGHFRSGIDEMIREAELEELQRKWAAENARIMSEHPMLPDVDRPVSPYSGAAGEPSPPSSETEAHPANHVAPDAVEDERGVADDAKSKGTAQP